MSPSLPIRPTDALNLLHGSFDPIGPLRDTYVLGIIANGVIFLTFTSVGVLLAWNMTRGKQWRGNILGAGTFAIITFCGIGHGIRFFQLMYPSLGIDLPFGLAARYEYNDWHPWVIDLITMVAGIWYWLMRGRFPDLVSGAAVYEDLRSRQRKALQIHDNVVQGIVRAKMALDLDDQPETDDALRDTLEASKRIIDDLLVTEDITGGGLRRKQRAGADDLLSDAEPEPTPNGGT